MTRVRVAVVSALLLVASHAGRASAAIDADIAAANAAGHSVFLVVHAGEARGMDTARKVASDAQKLVPGASILEMNRADKANEAAVKKYRLESVPVPLILVIASNGVAAAGARPEVVTAERLAKMVPSPAKAAHLKALEGKKASILVFARASMAARAGAQKAAADAVAALEGAAVVTSVDLDAENERAFVAELSVDAKADAPTTVVFNAKGERTETLAGAPTATSIVEAVGKQAAECCPGGRCK